MKSQSKPGADPYRTLPANPHPDDPLNEVPELEPLPDAGAEAGHSTGTAAPSTPSKEERAQADQPQKPGGKPKPVVGRVEYPEAKRSNRPGFHYSPYAPYELLDTQGIEPGGLAKDPGNGNIFRLPK